MKIIWIALARVALLAGSAAGATKGGSVALVAYSTPKDAYGQIISSFQKTSAGNGSSFSQTELDNFNFNISNGSAAVGTGITYTGVPATDYNGVNRPNPPSMGAVEP